MVQTVLLGKERPSGKRVEVELSRLLGGDSLPDWWTIDDDAHTVTLGGVVTIAASEEDAGDDGYAFVIKNPDGDNIVTVDYDDGEIQTYGGQITSRSADAPFEYAAIGPGGFFTLSGIGQIQATAGIEDSVGANITALAGFEQPAAYVGVGGLTGRLRMCDKEPELSELGPDSALSFWYDRTDGAPKLKFKGMTEDGTDFTFEIDLT